MRAFKSTRPVPRKSKLKTADGIRRRYERGHDITNIDTSELVDGTDMFFCKVFFNQNIGGWDVSSLINARYMFNRAYAFNQDLSGWDLPLDCDCSYMFDFSGMPFIADDDWRLYFIQFKNSILIQAGCRYFRTVEAALAHWNTKTHRSPERAERAALFNDAIRKHAEELGMPVPKLPLLRRLLRVMKGK